MPPATCLRATTRCDCRPWTRDPSSTSWPHPSKTRLTACRPQRPPGGACSPTSPTNCAPPLAAISAYLDALDDGVAVWDADTARVLRANTVRLARLAEDMAMVSRAEEYRLDLHPVPIDLAGLLGTVAASAGPAFAGKGVRLVVEAPDEERRRVGRRLLADRERLEQVLGNLLNNALRHTPTGGVVTIAARSGEDGVRISVTDTGEGITAEQLSHIFERFYRGDTARTRDTRGSGIGLTIARGIAMAHGGTLMARSDGPGAGATFELSLPWRLQAE